MAAGAPSVGIKAKNGVVIAVEKKFKSLLYDESSIMKVSNESTVYVKVLIKHMSN